MIPLHSTFVILFPGTFGVLWGNCWSAFVILSPGTIVIHFPGTTVVLLGHFWSGFGILSPSIFVILFLVLLEYFCCPFGVL